MTALSVVIPALNEAESLPALLTDLAAQRGCELEVLVADGGSTDETPQRARAAGASVVNAARGRGIQMNAGASAASSDFLLFLHADSRLPEPMTLAAALAQLVDARSSDGTPRIAAHFPIRFHRRVPGNDFLYAWLESKAILGRPGTINGDQGLLLPRDYFRELGCFDTRLPFHEDQRLAARVFDTGRWILLHTPIVTSARRFEVEGMAPRLTLMALLMGLHAAGHDPLLAEMPGIYAEHHRAGPLQLKPLTGHVRRALWRLGPAGFLRTLWRGGRYIRGNAWQLAFRRDVRRLGTEAGHRHPALDFFDRYLSRWLDNPIADSTALLLLATWLYIWLPITEDS